MKRLLIISVLMTLIFSGCSMMHDDRSGCERIVPRISSYTTGEVFGLYILDGNNVVVVANERVTTFDQNVHTDRELHHKDEYTYFLYSPYSYNPKGMPEVGDVVDTRTQMSSSVALQLLLKETYGYQEENMCPMGLV